MPEVPAILGTTILTVSLPAPVKTFVLPIPVVAIWTVSLPALVLTSASIVALVDVVNLTKSLPEPVNSVDTDSKLWPLGLVSVYEIPPVERLASIVVKPNVPCE